MMLRECMSEYFRTTYYSPLPIAFPPGNIIEFTVAASPVAAQARDKARKAQLRDEIRKLFLPLQYLLCGDVHVGIEWLIHEKDRYETDAAPDVDAILKPLLDAMCGPDGLLIDDSQVQSVTCKWVDHGFREQCLKFEIRFLSYEWVSKNRLIFVDFGESMCFPIEGSKSAELVLPLLETVHKMITTKRQIELETGDYYTAKRMLPTQRLFHRSRVAQHFTVIDEGAFVSRLRKEIEAAVATSKA
jgi:Holliday junction resolvase RusA-like endonuclease